MATQTMALITSLLKSVYEDKLVSQLQDEAIGFKRIQRTSDGVTERAGGKYVEFSIAIKRNQGISYRAESEALGAAGTSGYSSVQIPLKYGYGRLEVTGQLIELADGNPKAFADALSTEMDLLKDAIAKDQTRIFYGDASGLLCMITDATTSATHTVSDTYWLEVDMVVDILVATTGANLSAGLTISSINSDTNTVVFSASFASLTTHGVFRGGNFTAGTVREPNGLSSIVKNSGTLYNVNPSTVDKWKSTVTALGGSLSESAMIKMCDDIRVKGGKVSAIFTTLGVRRSYFNLLVQQRRFADTKSFDGGLNGLAFSYGGAEVPVVADPDLRSDYASAAYTGRMYFLEEGRFKIYQSHDWKFVDRDGSVLKWISGYDKYEALTTKYWELGVERRNAHGVLTTVTEN